MITAVLALAVAQAEQPVWFVDEAKKRDVQFTWISGDTGKFNMPEIIGGGGAMFDIDNDGDVDLYFVQGGHFDSSQTEQNILLRNDNGTFVDITEQSGAGDTGYGMGVAAGDFNNDGFVDLFVTNVGKNVLLQNNGDSTFSDVTDIAGLGDTGWGASAAFADFDADGDLDLYAINYLVWEHGLKLDCFNAKGALDYCSPTNYMAPAKDLLYRNNGDGSFTNMSERAGIGTRTATGLGVVCNDYTGDGNIDIYVANDGMADQLWQNNGNWSFTDVAAMRGCALDDEGKAKAGMGVTTDDIDNDGDFDILVCNLFGESDSLYQNEGDYFIDVTARKGIRTTTRHATRFGIGWVDFNNDGILDLYEANGRVQMIGTSLTDDPFAEENYLLQGTKTKWKRIDAVKDVQIHTSRSAIFGDVNNDGGVDILVINRDAPAYLLMNTHQDKTNAATFTIHSKHGRPALGAVITGKLGHMTFMHPVQSTWSYMAANDPRVHIGLGSESAVQDVSVRWVDGSSTNFGDYASGFHTLKQP